MKSLEEWVDKLKEVDKTIVVEGVKDKINLRKLGIPEKRIIFLDGPLYQIAEKIYKREKDCILLLDLDKEGKKLYSRLRHDLQRFGVKIDNKFREFLYKKTSMTYIEKIKLEEN
ncbi:toprim domain-containing protein [Candidatus Woesearchaeota archaeon]|nr:toprim domain-containing protein [Candidatus Woesearchaeota archaeon]